MRMRVAAAAVLVMAGAARGQATQPAVRWAGVMKGLSSPVYAEREAAQRSLEKATWRDVSALRALAASATDAEVKARLQQRLEGLELEMFVRPPLVSLEVKDARIEEVAGALSKATGVAWTAWPGGPKGGPWTLKAEERPLWELFTELEKQAGVHVVNYQGRVVLGAGEKQAGVFGHIQGGWTETVAGDYLFYVGMAQGAGLAIHTGPMDAAEYARPMIKLEYGFRGDPRLRLVRCGMPEILKVVDDQGKVLHAADAAAKPRVGAGGVGDAGVEHDDDFSGAGGRGAEGDHQREDEGARGAGDGAGGGAGSDVEGNRSRDGGRAGVADLGGGQGRREVGGECAGGRGPTRALYECPCVHTG